MMPMWLFVLVWFRARPAALLPAATASAALTESPVPAEMRPLHVLTAADRYLLERCVTAVAGERPLVCQTALASVVLNRLADDRFPGTVREILLTDRCFGSYQTILACRPGESAAVAVECALLADVTGGSLDYAVDDAGPLSFVPQLRAGGMSFGSMPRPG